MKKTLIITAFALSVLAHGETTNHGAVPPRRPMVLVQDDAASQPSIADQCEMVYHLSKEASYLRAGGAQATDLMDEFEYQAAHNPNLASYRDSVVLIARLIWGEPLADMDQPTALALSVQHDCLADPAKWLVIAK